MGAAGRVATCTVLGHPKPCVDNGKGMDPVAISLRPAVVTRKKRNTQAVPFIHLQENKQPENGRGDSYPLQPLPHPTPPLTAPTTLTRLECPPSGLPAALGEELTPALLRLEHKLRVSDIPTDTTPKE